MWPVILIYALRGLFHDRCGYCADGSEGMLGIGIAWLVGNAWWRWCWIPDDKVVAAGTRNKSQDSAECIHLVDPIGLPIDKLVVGVPFSHASVPQAMALAK